MQTQTTATPEQLKAALAVLMAVAETIREVGEIAEGPLYAVLMGRMDINAFRKMIDRIVATGLVEKRGDLLRWAGPHIPEAK